MKASTGAAIAPPQQRGRESRLSEIRYFLQDYGWAYLFIAVPVILFIFFKVYPLVWSLILSFQKYRITGGNEWIGLKNYADIFKGPSGAIYLKSLWNSIYYTIWTVPVGIAISLLLAVLIFPLPSKLQTFFKAAYYLPIATAGIVISMVWLWMFNPMTGLMNYLLSLFGLPPKMWLVDPRTAMNSLIFMALFGGRGYQIVLSLAAMGGIPRSIYEAAEIDAASWWSKLKNITLPLMKPTILYMFITGIIGSLQVFGPMYMMTKGGPMHSTMSLVYLIYTSAFEDYNFGYAAAQSFILGAIIIVVSLLQFKYMATDVEY